jgi:hypothetical protein
MFVCVGTLLCAFGQVSFWYLLTNCGAAAKGRLFPVCLESPRHGF